MPFGLVREGASFRLISLMPRQQHCETFLELATQTGCGLGPEESSKSKGAKEKAIEEQEASYIVAHSPVHLSKLLIISHSDADPFRRLVIIRLAARLTPRRERNLRSAACGN